MNSPSRRMAVGICVLALHGYLLLGLLADFSVKRERPTRTVQVVLLPSKPPPKLPPPPLPRFSQVPQIVAIQPLIITQPPPPDAIRAVPPFRAPPAPESATGPFEPPLLPTHYLSQLEAHLNAYKRYPHDARILRQEGTVELRFSLDRSGHVLSYNVVASSGFASLDNEVREMIRRADPFPPVPAEYSGQTLDLTVPLIFSLR